MIEIKDSLLWDCEIADCGIKKAARVRPKFNVHLLIFQSVIRNP